MHKQSFTRTVCRTGYGHREVTVHLPANASNQEVEAAIIEEAANHEFSDSDADYELVDAGTKRLAAAEHHCTIEALRGALSRAHRTLRKAGYDMTEIDRALAMADKTASPRVLVSLQGGVASTACDPGVDVVVFDWDNQKENPEGMRGAPLHFADLAAPLGVPVEEHPSDSKVAYRGLIYLYGSVRAFTFEAPSQASAEVKDAAALAAIARVARFAHERIGGPAKKPVQQA
jgi:hypothetical protein